MKKQVLEKFVAITVALIVLVNLTGFKSNAQQWNQVASITNAVFDWVRFVDEHTGYAGGYDQNSSFGIANGAIYKTTDGGTNWEQVYKDSSIWWIHQLSFANANVGYAVGDKKVIKTIDGGVTWTLLSTPKVRSTLYSVFFIDENTGWIGGGGKGDILKTTDGGITWVVQQSPASPGTWTDTIQYIRSMNFVDANNGFAVCLDNNKDVIKTTDGGNTWTRTPSAPASAFRGFFTSAAKGYVGDGGTVSRTLDGGVTWATLNLSSFGVSGGPGDVYSPDGINWYMACSEGILKLTETGPTTISGTLNTTPMGCASLHFPTANIGYAVGGGKIYKYTENTSPIGITKQPVSAPIVCDDAGIATFGVNVTGTGPFTYRWQENTKNLTDNSIYSGVNTATLTITNPGYSFNKNLYRCYVTNVNGNAVTSHTVTLTVDSVIANAGNGQAICSGSFATLNATGGTSYSWLPAVSLNTATGASVTANPTANTTYTVITTNLNGCIGKAFVEVLVQNALILSAGENSSICPGSGTILTASGGSNYSWYPTTGLSNASTANPIASPTVTTTYSLTSIGGNCAITPSSVKVIVMSIPTPIVISDSPICAGSSANLQASGAVSYVWTSSSQAGNIDTGSSVSLTPLVTTNYTVTATDINNCKTMVSTSVVVNPLPTITIAGNTTLCKGSAINLLASGATGYSWTSANGINIGNAASVTANPTITTTYSVTGTLNGCSNSKAITIIVSNCSTVGMEETSIENSLMVYPNPSSGNINVFFTPDELTTDVIVRVLDIQGKVIYTENNNCLTGEFKTNINLSQQAKGPYFLQIITDKASFKKKIVLANE